MFSLNKETVRNNEQEKGKYRAVRRNANVTDYGGSKRKESLVITSGVNKTFIFIK